MSLGRILVLALFLAGEFLLLGLVCVHINGTAIAHLLPDFGTPLCKSGLPFLEILKGYQGWSKLSFAHVGSLLVFLAVSYLWPHTLAVFLTPRCQERRGWDLGNTSRFLLFLGVAVLAADAILFWIGSYSGGWGGYSGRAFPATVITAMYVGLLLTAAYITLRIMHAE